MASPLSFVCITGAGSGIGRAMAVRFSAEPGVGVICVGRREHKLHETKQLCRQPQDVTVLAADVSTEQGRRAVVDCVSTMCPQGLQYLVQNAGVVGPLKATLDLKLDNFRQTMATNVEAPIFLSRDLFPLLKKAHGRILHVSSGCAHKPSQSWLAYCTSKAALLMVYQCLNLEWKGQVAVGSFKPGIVESEMQDEMRKASSSDFPKVGHFKKLKEIHDAARKADVDSQPHFPDPSRLDSAENVAHFAWFLLTKTSDEAFVAKDWDIREERDWLKAV